MSKVFEVKTTKPFEFSFDDKDTYKTVCSHYDNAKLANINNLLSAVNNQPDLVTDYGVIDINPLEYFEKGKGSTPSNKTLFALKNDSTNQVKKELGLNGLHFYEYSEGDDLGRQVSAIQPTKELSSILCFGVKPDHNVFHSETNDKPQQLTTIQLVLIIIVVLLVVGVLGKLLYDRFRK